MRMISLVSYETLVSMTTPREEATKCKTYLHARIVYSVQGSDTMKPPASVHRQQFSTITVLGNSMKVYEKMWRLKF
jgi:hypothetical protein